jgi:hypothetical protein
LRWKDGEWEENLLSPRSSKTYSVPDASKYLSTLNKLHIKFNRNIANTETPDFKEYILKGDLTVGRYCELAKKYYFIQDSSESRIDLRTDN